MQTETGKRISGRIRSGENAYSGAMQQLHQSQMQLVPSSLSGEPISRVRAFRFGEEAPYVKLAQGNVACARVAQNNLRFFAQRVLAVDNERRAMPRVVLHEAGGKPRSLLLAVCLDVF